MRTRAALCLLVATVLAGCGDDEEAARPATETERTTAAGPVVATVEVSATDFRFTPANPGVQDTGVIAFELTNDGQATHALEVEGPGGEVETRPLKPGERQTIKANLNRPGRYTWYCPIGDHRQRGMVGFVLVAGGGGAGGSGTTTGGSGTEGQTETGGDSGGSGDPGSGGSSPQDDSRGAPDRGGSGEEESGGGTPAPY